MTAPGKLLMDAFYEHGRTAGRNHEQKRKRVFETAENAVNSIMHGRTPQEMFNRVEGTLNKLLQRAMEKGTAEEQAAWRDAIQVLQTVRGETL